MSKPASTQQKRIWIVTAGIAGLAVAIPFVANLPWKQGDITRSSQAPRTQVERRALDAIPPAAPLNLYKPLTPTDAVAENSAVPIVQGALEKALPFILQQAQIDAGAVDAARECMTAAIYYEAAGQPISGQRAVGQVILNRLRHPAYPKTICGVIYQGSELSTGCQFSFTCDGSLGRRPSARGWEVARKVALSTLSGDVEPSVGMATNYHADYVVPYWSSSLQKIASIGNHIFYRYAGSWGRRAAFRGVYAGDAAKVAEATIVSPQITAEAMPVEESGSLPPRKYLQADDVARLEAPRSSFPSGGISPALRADEEKGELIVREGRR
ncbi:cell wall hydrolase [Sphingomonas sp. M1-B02]|uniref:cell wall hydrolase n=1 Tax=Sphingomonas sp. M1-B02 TaxID=3114300 RepID=UPI00224051D6|nr:cell wall hydrolase [Sphingomonas sp. S6-11]UZK67724.1 cell wall hydrolase [Sphingomonas sp. S6-11]